MYKFLVSILFTFLKDPESVHHLALLYLRFLGLPPFNTIARENSICTDEEGVERKVSRC
jgi:hypothetical protein